MNCLAVQRWLLMADSSEVPNKISAGIRIAVFWIGLPFIGILLAGDRFFAADGNRYQVAGCLLVAFLSIVIAVKWDKLLPRRWRSPAEISLRYLSHRDSELGSAVVEMAFRSAWGRWFAARALVAGGNRVQYNYLLQVAAGIVLEKIVDGELGVRGRRPGHMDFEPIPATHWRSSALHFVPDNISLWKLTIIPRGGVEFGPDGTIVRADHPASADRTSQLSVYDSLIVDARQFERLWPRREPVADKARRAFVRKAWWRGIDRDERRRLCQD